VRLKSNPEGEVGIVERIVAGKAVVRWPNCTTRHAPDRLVTVRAKAEPKAPDAAPRLNPYERLLQKLDVDNGKKAR
jgi:hypothetical protein